MYVHSFDCGQNQRQRESSRITKAFLFCSFHLFPICTCRPDQLFLAKMRRLTAFIYLTTVSKRTSENLFHFSFRFIFFPFSKSLFGWKVERKRKRQLKHSLFPSPSAFFFAAFQRFPWRGGMNTLVLASFIDLRSDRVPFWLLKSFSFLLPPFISSLLSLYLPFRRPSFFLSFPAPVPRETVGGLDIP